MKQLLQLWLIAYTPFIVFLVWSVPFVSKVILGAEVVLAYLFLVAFSKITQTMEDQDELVSLQEHVEDLKDENARLTKDNERIHFINMKLLREKKRAFDSRP